MIINDCLLRCFSVVIFFAVYKKCKKKWVFACVHIYSFIFVQLNLNPFYSFTYGAIEKSFF